MFWFVIRFVLFSAVSIPAGLLAEAAGYSYYLGLVGGLVATLVIWTAGFAEAVFDD